MTQYVMPPPADARSIATGILVGGRWQPAADGSRFDVLDPADGSLITSVANADTADAMAAVDAAAAAASGWAATPPRRRGEILRKAFELMTERAEWFARLMSLENGKLLADARGEVTYAAEFFRWFSEEAVRIVGEFGTAPSGSNRILVDYQPVGISLLITPWNFPAAMATRKLGPALAAGCTCILKPAAETPLTALALAALLEEAGLPPGVLSVLPTTRPAEMTRAMLHDPRVRKLSFTGSTGVGRALLREAADNVVNCSMELGGNAPLLVFDDADLDAAVEGTMIAKMRNGGQACTAANRIYVHAGVHDRFVAAVVERISGLKLGRGTEPGTGCAPLNNAKGVAKVEALLEDARGRGGKVLTGGRRADRPGFYFEPTVVTEVPPGAQIHGEEIFGPVLNIVRFETEDEAIRLANATEYGLVSYVFTGDLKRGMRVCRALDSGMVGLNRGLVSDPAAPFGGNKQSGIGREGAHVGLMAFLESKYIAVEF